MTTQTLTQDEHKFLALLDQASPADRNFIQIATHFYARKSWTPAMQHHLTVLAALCVAEPASTKPVFSGCRCTRPSNQDAA